MSIEAKTGALWERKDDDEEDEDVVISSKLFLNRKAQRDFRVNEIFRKGALDLEKEIGVVESDNDEEETNDTEKNADAENVEKELEDVQEEKTGEKPVVPEALVKRVKDEEKKTEAKEETREEINRKLEEKCTKEEYTVAKHVRFNTQEHIGRLAGMTVKCFIASDAINCLLDSQWAKGNADPDSEIILTDRKSCVNLMNRFLQKGLLHRADKVESKKDKERKKKKKEIEEKEKKKEAIDEKKKEQEEEEDSKALENTTDEKISNKERRLKKMAEKEAEEAKKEEKKKETANKQKKFKLNMSDDQRFVDGNAIYVWIYDPIRPKTFFIGFLMLLGAVGLCLFPLWPDWMRIAVYYTSLAGATFVGFMLFLIVLRVIIFSMVWIVTFGKHHVWIFPNLTEDVGIIDSFRPLLKHDVYPPPEVYEEQLKVKEKKKLKEKKEKEEEENDDKNENGFEMIESKEGVSNEEDQDKDDDDDDDDDDNQENDDPDNENEDSEEDRS